MSEDDLTQQEVSQCVGAEHIENGFRADDVAARFRHLAFFEEDPPVRHNLLRERDAGGEQEGGPIYAMEANDLFADHVQVGGPELGKAFLVLRGVAAVSDGGDVVTKSVEPDIDDVLGVVGDGYSPGETAARYGEIAESAAQEGDDFVAARVRLYEFGMLLEVVEQRLLHGGELEVVVLFADGFGGTSALRAGRAGADDIYV